MIAPKIRTRDRVRTRQQILDAATEEFAAKGFEGARTDEIAKRADVAKRMLYHYFTSKDGLFQAVLEQTYSNIRNAEENLKLSSLDPKKAMTELVVFSFDWFVNHPEFISILNEENLLGAVHAKSSNAVRRLNMPLVDTISTLLKTRRGKRAVPSGCRPGGALHFHRWRFLLLLLEPAHIIRNLRQKSIVQNRDQTTESPCG